MRYPYCGKSTRNGQRTSYLLLSIAGAALLSGREIVIQIKDFGSNWIGSPACRSGREWRLSWLNLEPIAKTQFVEALKRITDKITSEC
jgi:hypothetical protein